ncbi:MAG: hypothetical protein PHQ63_05980 [Smithellaceae bacterium]|nr:hypothetical protein [Smithellaceae bacterium]
MGKGSKMFSRSTVKERKGKSVKAILAPMAQILKNHIQQKVETWRFNGGAIDRNKAKFPQGIVIALFFEQERHLGNRRTIS